MGKELMTSDAGLPFDESQDASGAGPYGKYSTGILPSHVLRRLIRARREVLATDEITEAQIQPASVDLRLGNLAYRVRASFLPGKDNKVAEKLEDIAIHEIDLKGGAVLETGCVYVVPLIERLELSFRVSGVANPKSSTGRLDVFTRLITDHAQSFDRVEENYHGPLYAEISPRTFPLLVRKGSRLNQLRLRHGSPGFSDTQLKRLHEEVGLVDRTADIEGGLALTVDLQGDSLTRQVGWRARRHAGVIDVDRVAAYDALDFWDPVYARKGSGIVLDPDEFYILASREAVSIPPDYAA